MPREGRLLMEQDAAPREALGEVVPLKVAGRPPTPPEQLIEQAFRIAVGMGVLALGVCAETVSRTLGRDIGEEEIPSDATVPAASGLPLMAGALIGVAVEAGRWSARAATTAYRSAELLISLAMGPGIVQEPLRRAESGLSTLDARWREQRSRDEEAAAAFLRLLTPEIVRATLDQVDLNELVEARIDLDRIVDDVDLDRAVRRLDLDAVVERIDIDQILDRVDLAAVADRLPLQEIVARIDIDDIVARVDLDRVVERIDLNAVADRLDLEAIVRRLDLTAIASEVLEELDLPEIIRDAMGSMRNETVGGIRVQSMNADRAISRLVDRVLQRHRDREGAGANGSEREDRA